MNENFKIIAIRTGERQKNTPIRKGIRLDYLKVLKSNTIYPFYSTFKFPENDFSTFQQKEVIDLYSINGKSVNINAIVGGNGSGKSTLIDLLCWANYNIGAKLKLIRDEKNRLLSPFKFLDLEILFCVNFEKFKCIKFTNGNITSSEYLKNGNSFTLASTDEITTIEDLHDFFYSVVINYSLYSLNSLEVGEWIKPLFHKNDGYQTPLVLNPMRTDGKIDINREKRLLSRRLIANTLEDIGEREEKDSLRNLANGKIAKTLILNYVSIADFEEPKGEIIKEILPHLKKYFNIEISQSQLDNNMFVNVTLNYLVVKLIKIANTYKPYKKYKEGKSIKWLNAYLQRVFDSDSHIFFKVKGAILYLKYAEKIFNDKSINLNERIYISIEHLSELTQNINKNEKFWVNTFMMVPPSFFSIEIEPEDKTAFDFLSSGEKQRIHSISSIVYHLINLNSVEQLKESQKDEQYISYKYINIILDEIELYYHPDWQRTYISDFISYLERVNPKNLNKIKGINISFLTHSPYILSDIPLSNVIRLENGEVSISDKQTFGANIHDLLANDFFMKEGAIGKFAKDKIQGIIDELNGKSNEMKKENIFSLINIIGEPFLKSKLLEMYYSKYDKDKRIQELKEEINRLEQVD
jgi:hypothetical protein